MSRDLWLWDFCIMDKTIWDFKINKQTTNHTVVKHMRDIFSRPAAFHDNWNRGLPCYFNKGNLWGNQCNLCAGVILEVWPCFMSSKEHVMSLFICYLHLILLVCNCKCLLENYTLTRNKTVRRRMFMAIVGYLEADTWVHMGTLVHPIFSIWPPQFWVPNSTKLYALFWG